MTFEINLSNTLLHVKAVFSRSGQKTISGKGVVDVNATFLCVINLYNLEIPDFD